MNGIERDDARSVVPSSHGKGSTWDTWLFAVELDAADGFGTGKIGTKKNAQEGAVGGRTGFGIDTIPKDTVHSFRVERVRHRRSSNGD